MCAQVDTVRSCWPFWEFEIRKGQDTLIKPLVVGGGGWRLGGELADFRLQNQRRRIVLRISKFTFHFWQEKEGEDDLFCSGD